LKLDNHLPFLSCDWGTSSFRLRLVSNGNVQREIRQPSGVRSLYEQSLAQQKDRATIFEEFLRAKIAEFGGAGEGLPLVISGMASSTIGWRELPYSKTPFTLDGSGMRVEKIHWNNPATVGETFLISGVATETDVMRGEETQVLGIMAAPERAQLAERCVVILPGTHSKHVHIENANVQTFCTYMTGELFAVLSHHSVLRATVEPAARVESNNAFREGALSARDRGLAASLFSVRARGVLGKATHQQNAAFLSGLLIGSELMELRASIPLLIAATGSLVELYSAAARVVSPELKFQSLLAEEVDLATVSAHALILSKFS
jgi:2-dehydro-3-deoxygalactonokinase